MANTAVVPITGFNAMGKPIPYERRTRAYNAARRMGLSQEEAMQAVDALVEQLQRDKPYEAMQMASRFVDLTGTYALMAYLLV